MILQDSFFFENRPIYLHISSTRVIRLVKQNMLVFSSIEINNLLPAPAYSVPKVPSLQCPEGPQFTVSRRSPVYSVPKVPSLQCPEGPQSTVSRRSPVYSVPKVPSIQCPEGPQPTVSRRSPVYSVPKVPSLQCPEGPQSTVSRRSDSSLGANSHLK